MRIVLAGAATCTIAAAAIAWFNEPPFASRLFYMGIVMVGIGVSAGMLGMLILGRKKEQ